MDRNVEIKRFEGKRALITGGASGIGRATVRRLAEEGAEVVIADQDADSAALEAAWVEERGGKARSVFVDLRDEASIAAMVETATDGVPTIDVLVNCAGTKHLAGPLETSGVEGWDVVMTVNLKAQAIVIQGLLGALKEAHGAIVNVSSDGAFAAREGLWIYDASKAGLSSLTRSSAAAFAQYGIRVNTVAPGGVITEWHFGEQADPLARKRALETDELETCLMRRWAYPQEIAAAIAFLASEDASYITGTTLSVDGGGWGMR